MPYLPHQEFFGIANDDPLDRISRWDSAKALQYRWHPKPGSLEIEMFLHLKGEATQLHTATDVSDVLVMLRSKSLPPELCLSSLKLAEYWPRRRDLVVPRGPLHPQNYEELRKYLTYCWILLLRCDMFAKELGDVIFWKRLVGTCIVELWGNTRDCREKMYTVPEFWEPSWRSQYPESVIAREDRFDEEHRFI